MKPSAPARRGREKKLPTVLAVGSFAFGGEIPERDLQLLLGHYLGALGFPKAGLSLMLCDDKESRRLNPRLPAEGCPHGHLVFPS